MTSLQVKGGEPLLKLIAVDWFKVDNPATKVAMYPKSLIQVTHALDFTSHYVIRKTIQNKTSRSLVWGPLKMHFGKKCIFEY